MKVVEPSCGHLFGSKRLKLLEVLISIKATETYHKLKPFAGRPGMPRKQNFVIFGFKAQTLVLLDGGQGQGGHRQEFSRGT